MRRIAAHCACLLLAACATAPAPPIPLDGLPTAFDMAGRVSITSDGRGDIARIRWSHRPDTDIWILSSPVGAELARVERNGRDLVVHRPGAVPLQAGTFGELSEHLLGTSLDDRLLVAWVHGRPVAGPDGWAVTIDESRRAERLDIARRITAIRDGITVKLVVDSYEARP